MIDIIVFWESYKHKKLFEIQQINKQDNPTNTITKISLNKILEGFLNTNKLQIQIKG
jgi:hypothetical protein